MITPVLLAFLALILAYIGSHRHLTKLQFLFIALFFGAGGIFVLFPNLATGVAQRLNVGRGADLLLYFAALSGVLVAANFYFRFKQTERILTEIVRQLAISSPVHEARQEQHS
jgi:hypothetical protein